MCAESRQVLAGLENSKYRKEELLADSVPEFNREGVPMRLQGRKQ